MSNQTWTDELDTMQLRKLDMVEVEFCDDHWDCNNPIDWAIEHKLQIGITRWVFFCNCCMTGE